MLKYYQDIVGLHLLHIKSGSGLQPVTFYQFNTVIIILFLEKISIWTQNLSGFKNLNRFYWLDTDQLLIETGVPSNAVHIELLC